jgi:hypothetical protein
MAHSRTPPDRLPLLAVLGLTAIALLCAAIFLMA